jgi:hypothetical protein
MTISSCAAAGTLLLSTACFDYADDPGYALLDPEPRTLGVGAVEQLELPREPGAAPPTVRAQLALSDYAVAGFERLEARVTLSGAESSPDAGLRAEWLPDPDGKPPFRGYLENELPQLWSAQLSADDCTQPPCVLSFEFTPTEQWSVSFERRSIEYELRAWLEVHGHHRYEFDELNRALSLALEQAP